MSTIPISVKDHIANAHYYLEAADKFPSPTRNGVHILLLLIARENVQIAKEELSSWAQKTALNRKLYKSHPYKLRKAKPITQTILGQKGIPEKTNIYCTGADFEKLFSICRYGSKTGRKALTSFFKKGSWDISPFRNSLIDQIEWVETMVGIYENSK